MSDPREERPEPAERRAPRHAAPRTPVRLRLRGRALAMAAVPTALLMAATYTPNPAIAETAASKPCATAPDAPQKVAETPVPKSELPPPIPGPSVPLPEAPATAVPEPTAAPGTGPTTAPATPPAETAPTASAAPATAPAATAPAPEPAATKARTAGGGGAVQAGLIGDIVGGVTDLLLPGAAPSPTATASPSAGTHAVAPAAPAPTASGAAPSTAPAGTATPTSPATTAPPTKAPSTTAPATTAPTSPKPTAAPSTGAPATGSAAPSASAGAKTTGKASAKPAAGSAAATPSASGTPSKDPNCLVDSKALSPAGKPPDNPILVPDQNWTLQTSRLTLNHAVLLGVVNVQTPTGTKRVLKFEVETVDIENLHMTTLEGNGKTFHVKGAPGSVSTMRKGPVIMYVERLSGHLAKVLGLPIPIDLGELTLTPDGPLPQWLYDLIGQLQVPLWIELTGVTAIQSGQFGGTLKIPGMKLYNDDQPYPGAA
ncbi:hypothetical protein [Kitasatospora purpeofusca]|uniref:hypothetical protein n=1 Tax=Kitasatospora purpeofusca TaxID=67352 RepID=UPI003657F873